MPDGATSASVALSNPSDVIAPKELDSSLVPSVGTADQPVFPVSMVVHGGTGILHGNMTSLTVNQYIGVVPDRNAWDTGKVRELMADAVKVSADANHQLFHPETNNSHYTSGFPGNLFNQKQKRNGWWLLLAGLVLLFVVPLATMASYTKFFSSNPVVEPYKAAETRISRNASKEVEDIDPSGINKENAPRILPRSSWLAQPPRVQLEHNTLPVSMVVVIDTRTEECLTSAECVSALHFQQLYDMDSQKFDDIAFNFLIGGDGNVYTGRGWDSKGAHTKGRNTGSLGVAFIGTFSQKLPKHVQVEAFNKLMEVGVEINKISANYTLVNHCQLRTDGYFELALATNMTSWPHFDSSYPISRCALP